MSCIGLDVGNEYCRVGTVRQGGVDIFLNEESTRETPTMIVFGDRQRFIGTSAAASAIMNLKNTVWQIKRLVGKKFKDPEVQSDLKLLPCTVTEGRDGWPLIHVNYMGEHRTFKAAELLGMVLAHLKAIAARSTGMPIGDCVIGVPAFMDDVQRRGYLDAAAIAGLKPLKLIHETTAAALSYGLYKTDLPAQDEVYVVFVDVGHAHTQVAVAAFKNGELRILAYAFDRCLGGRDFDEVLFNHFAAQFSSKYNINVLSSPRACQRLRAACEKLKKVLSANAEAPISIECLMDEKDVKGFMTRDEFERLSTPLLHRIRHTCERAITDSELAIDNIYAVEVIGSGSRIPAIARVLVSAFRREPSRTLNASESITRGSALQAAVLSPTFKIRQFEVQDYFLFPIALWWSGPPAFEYGSDEAANASASLVPQILPNSAVFHKGASFPVTKHLTFTPASSTFEARPVYCDTTDLSAGTPASFAVFTVGPLNYRNNEKVRLKLCIQLNQHGVFMISSATLIEDEELEPSAASNKRKMRLLNVPVVGVPTKELSDSQLQNALEKQFEMELQDRVTEETNEVKNALEALVYGLRNKFSGQLQEYASEEEKVELLKKLQDTETWLYEEGDNESKGVYSAKLEELRKYVNVLEKRQAEEHAREFAITDKIAPSCRVDRSQIRKVLHECNQAEQWMQDVKHHQDIVPGYARHVVRTSDIKNVLYACRSCKSALIGDLD